MKKKEILEIKKQFTPENCCITRIATCYVNSEKEIVLSKAQAFLSLAEEEAFKYFDMFRKSLSGKKGKNLYDIQFKTEESNLSENFMDILRKTKLKDPEVLEEFYDKVINSYNTCENYLITIIHGVYDIPGKTTDGVEMFDASDSAYEHILCCICPVILSKPGLSVNLKKTAVEDRVRDWVVDHPSDGFLYPSFNDRSEDIHELLYYTKKKIIEQTGLIMELTGREENILSNDEEKEIIRDILIETTTMDLSAMRDLTLNMDEIIEESEEEELMISGKQLGKMLEKQGVSEEERENFLAAYQTKLGNKGVHLSSLFDRRKMDIKTQEASVKVEMDRVFDIETRTVDGRVYLMIPLNNNVVEVNGVPVKGYDKKIDG